MNRDCLIIIPARKGSKGIKGKNIIDLGGKLLIQWTIEAAIKCSFSKKIIVSTDCTKIANSCKALGAEVNGLRPNYLSTDSASSNDVIDYEIKKNDFNGIVIMLQATSPLRNTKHIEEAYKIFTKGKMHSLVSVKEKSKGIYWTFSRDRKGNIKSLFKSIPKRRQDMKSCFELNGAIYITHTKYFNKAKTFFTDQTFGYIMDEKSSVDIDTKADLLIAEKILKNDS